MTVSTVETSVVAQGVSSTKSVFVNVIAGLVIDARFEVKSSEGGAVGKLVCVAGQMVVYTMIVLVSVKGDFREDGQKASCEAQLTMVYVDDEKKVIVVELPSVGFGGPGGIGSVIVGVGVESVGPSSVSVGVGSESGGVLVSLSSGLVSVGVASVSLGPTVESVGVTVVSGASTDESVMIIVVDEGSELVTE